MVYIRIGCGDPCGIPEQLDFFKCLPYPIVDILAMAPPREPMPARSRNAVRKAGTKWKQDLEAALVGYGIKRTDFDSVVEKLRANAHASHFTARSISTLALHVCHIRQTGPDVDYVIQFDQSMWRKTFAQRSGPGGCEHSSP